MSTGKAGYGARPAVGADGQVPVRARHRHCWVSPTQGASAPHPGLVIDWRRGPDQRWQPRVTYVVVDDDDTVVVTQWLSSDMVRPA